jgi:4-hydroxybenzoate polyprenyltransferase
VDVDRVNQSRHFEKAPAETIRLGAAVGLACLILGMAMAFRLGTIETGLAGVVACGVAAYSLLLRRYLLIPTLLVSFLAVSPLWAPLILWPRGVSFIHWAFLAATILILAARETLMDVRDREGDQVGRRSTVTTLFGPTIGKAAAGVSLLSGVALLCLVLIMQMAHLKAPDRLAAAMAACPVFGFVMLPAKRAVLEGGRDGADHAAIQKFVVQSRTAMAFLPLLNLWLWGR